MERNHKTKLPQYNIRWLAAVMESLYLALPLLSIINFLSISVVLYTSVQEYMKTWVPWMTFPIFLVIIAVLTVLTVALTWVFLVPSLWALRGQQMFGRETRGNEEGSRAANAKTTTTATVAVSGGFDPLNGKGHATHIREARKLGDRLVVILSRDDQLIAKGNKPNGTFYPSFEDRKAIMELVADEVVANIDGDLTSTKSLRMVRPQIFAKGGDRTPDNMPESELKVCQEIGCTIVYGVGEPKTTSSSELVRRNA